MTCRERYESRKSKGLCPRCGKEKQSNEKVYCDSCREWAKSYREWVIDKKLCPMCYKNKLHGDEKTCVDCLAKAYAYNRAYREKNKEVLNEKGRIRSKKRILSRKKQGLCTKCGKRKATEGYSTCQLCRYKATEYSHTLDKYLGIGKGNRA